MKVFQPTIGVILVALLSACGGGGGGGDTSVIAPPTLPTPPVAPATIDTASALKNLAATRFSWSSAKDSSTATAGVFATTFSSSSTFSAPDGTKISNLQVSKFQIDTSLDTTIGNNRLATREFAYLAFDKDATRLVGFWWDSEIPSGRTPAFCMYNPNITIPATSTVGTSGVLVNGPAYSGDLSCPLGRVQYDAKIVWSLEEISKTNNFCYARETGFQSQDVKLCFPVTNNGAINPNGLTLILRGKTYTK